MIIAQKQPFPHLKEIGKYSQKREEIMECMVCKQQIKGQTCEWCKTPIGSKLLKEMRAEEAFRVEVQYPNGERWRLQGVYPDALQKRQI